MLQRLRKYRVKCDTCKAVKTFDTTDSGEHPDLPKGWKVRYERHCDEHYCNSQTAYHTCPACVVKKKKKGVKKKPLARKP